MPEPATNVELQLCPLKKKTKTKQKKPETDLFKITVTISNKRNALLKNSSENFLKNLQENTCYKELKIVNLL